MPLVLIYQMVLIYQTQRVSNPDTSIEGTGIQVAAMLYPPTRSLGLITGTNPAQTVSERQSPVPAWMHVWCRLDAMLLAV